jgi:hypothetical protein
MQATWVSTNNTNIEIHSNTLGTDSPVRCNNVERDCEVVGLDVLSVPRSSSDCRTVRPLSIYIRDTLVLSRCREHLLEDLNPLSPNIHDSQPCFSILGGILSLVLTRNGDFAGFSNRFFNAENTYCYPSMVSVRDML